jgi:hypothetical protein
VSHGLLDQDVRHGIRSGQDAFNVRSRNATGRGIGELQARSVDAKTLDQATFDLSVKNLGGGEEVVHRTPQAIMVSARLPLATLTQRP